MIVDYAKLISHLKVGDKVLTPEYPGYQSGVSGEVDGAKPTKIAFFTPDDPPAEVVEIYQRLGYVKIRKQDGVVITTGAGHRLVVLTDTITA